jgi:hypothetical protein
MERSRGGDTTCDGWAAGSLAEAFEEFLFPDAADTAAPPA